MTSAVLLETLGNGVLLDALGVPLNGHQVYVYQRGTTTQVQVFSNSGLSVALSQPLSTGSSGASPGGIPGYVPGEQAIDLHDATANTTEPGEPVAAADLLVLFAQSAHTPSGSATIGTSSSQLVAANTLRGALEIYNLDAAAQVFGALGATAVANQGFLINPNGGAWRTPQDTGGVVFQGAVNLISTLSSTSVCYVEV